MSNLLALNNNLTMTSLEIAEMTGKQHKHVLQNIRNMFTELGILTTDFSAVRIDDRGKEREIFNLNKQLTITLISGYNNIARYKIVDRWLELEEQSSFTIPTTFAGALALAAKMAEENEKLGVTVQGQIVTIHQQAGVIDHKRIVTDESDTYFSVARVGKLNPTQRFSGKLLARISNELGIAVIPQHAAKGQIPINTYHTRIWELVYPEASLYA